MADLQKDRPEVLESLFYSARDKIGSSFTKTPVGRNTMGAIGREVAEILLKPNPDDFTGHCWRRSAATAAAENGATTMEMRGHFDWSSDQMCKEYVEKSKPMTRNMAKLLQGAKSPGEPEVFRASTSSTTTSACSTMTSASEQKLDSGSKEDSGTVSAGGKSSLSTEALGTQTSEDLDLHISSDDELDSQIMNLPPDEFSPPRKVPKVVEQPVQVLSQVLVKEKEIQKETSNLSSTMSGFNFSNCQITFHVTK